MADEFDIDEMWDEDDWICCPNCGQMFENDGGGLFCSADCEEADENALW